MRKVTPTSEVTYSTKVVDRESEITGRWVTFGLWDHSSCVPMQNTLLRGQLGQSGFYIDNGQAMTKAQNTQQKSNICI